MKERAYQISIAVLVLIIVVLAWALIATRAGESPERMGQMATTTYGTSTVSQEQGSVTSPADTQTTTNEQVASTGSDTVSASDQAAGMSVLVNSVSVNQPSWIAVRESSGNVLGAALVSAGQHTQVEVPLLRGTVPSAQYQILLYADNGDKQFDLHKDSLIMNTDGSIAGTTFSTTAQ